MKIRWRSGIAVLDPTCSRLDGLLSWCWWGLQSPKARRSRGSPPWHLRLLTKRNLTVWALLIGWGIYYFTFQFHSSQEPWYADGPLFTAQPSIWRQGHRHIVLDYFLSYSWVLIFISVGSGSMS